LHVPSRSLLKKSFSPHVIACYWRKNDEIEVLLAIMREVAHFVIDTKCNLTRARVCRQCCAIFQEIEQYDNTGDLRMMVAP